MGIVSQGYGFSIPQVTCSSTQPVAQSPDENCVVGPIANVMFEDPPSTCVSITWTLRPYGLNPAEFVFDVQRSGSPGFRSPEDFEVVAESRLGILSYEDQDVAMFDDFREYYYRIVARSLSNPATEFVSPVVRAKSRPSEKDLIVREIRWLHDSVLLARYTGIPCAIFLAKTYGQRCHACYSEILGRCSDGKCRECFRTTFLGGYFLPIPRYVQFAPPPKRSSLDIHGKQHRTFTSAMLAHDPLLKPGDLIKDLQSGEVWDVASVEPPTAKLGAVAHQNALLYRLDRDDIEREVASDVNFSNLCELEWRAVLG